MGIIFLKLSSDRLSFVLEGRAADAEGFCRSGHIAAAFLQGIDDGSLFNQLGGFAGHFFKVSGLGPCAAHAASDFRRKVVNIQEIAF